jgi:hypothetical protein
MALDYSEIKGRANLTYNVGGFMHFLFCRKSLCTSIPDPLDIEDIALATVDQLVKVTDPITFAGNDGFTKMYCTLKKGTGKGVNNAEQDATGLDLTYEGFVSGLNAEDLGNLQMAQSDELIVLGVTADGKYMRLGNSQVGAFLKYEFDVATMGGGVRGAKVTISAFDKTVCIYEGTVTMATPAS